MIVFAELLLLGQTIWGEARGETQLGRAAVAWVIRNRVESPIEWWGNTYTEVCLKPKQFSCWNDNDPNKKKMATLNDLSYTTFAACVAAGAMVIAGQAPDPTNGATHYHTTSIDPAWDDEMECTCTIGRHSFYKRK